MRIFKTIIAALLILVGAVFALQGANIITDSALMSGQSRWLYIGLAMVVAGLALLFQTYVARRRT